MTLQDLGGLAEVVGAIATVGALVYLAVQIRANRASVRAESRRASFETVVPALLAIAESEELARIFEAGLVDLSKLNSIDRTRFTMLFALFVSPLSVRYDEARIGIELDSSYIAGTIALLRTSGGRQWWRNARDRYNQEFRKYVESEILLDEQPAAAEHKP